MADYNPNSRYTWKPEDKFQITGQQFGLILNMVRSYLGTEEAGKFMLMQQTNDVIETSPGSQQWGYILTEPCKERSVVENLLTGLVHKICPDGIDSGMLGVTRYVRLPEGYNTKASKVA